MNVCQVVDVDQVCQMPALNMTVKHGQPKDAVRANFEKVINEARATHSRWIRNVEWSPDHTSAVLSGPAYEITLTIDDENVYARGSVPVPAKWLEGSVRRFVEQTLAQSSP
jgi:hypothetical protein